jgi:hypothetical protein
MRENTKKTSSFQNFTKSISIIMIKTRPASILRIVLKMKQKG